MSHNEASLWRNMIVRKIGGYDSKVHCIDPTLYYNFLDSSTYDSEREIREFDLYKVRHSNLIIVNFNSPNSIGTAQELAVAAEYRIPIIGLNEDGYILHPWLTECCNKIFTDMDKLVEYVHDYYLI